MASTTYIGHVDSYLSVFDLLSNRVIALRRGPECCGRAWSKQHLGKWYTSETNFVKTPETVFYDIFISIMILWFKFNKIFFKLFSKKYFKWSQHTLHFLKTRKEMSMNAFTASFIMSRLDTYTLNVFLREVAIQK